jgi:hypothetical protein
MWDPRENALGYTPEEDKLRLKAIAEGGWAAQEKITMMRDERRRRERLEQMRRKWVKSEEGRAFQKLAQSFEACEKLLSEDADAEQQAQEVDEENYAVYTKLRENLEHANRAPRCCYRKTSGELCRAPKMKGQEYCCMHLAMTTAKQDKFELPPLDDANAVQVAITQGARGLLDGTLDEKRAMRLAYYLQLAVSNVSRVSFEPLEDEEFEDEEEGQAEEETTAAE